MNFVVNANLLAYPGERNHTWTIAILYLSGIYSQQQNCENPRQKQLRNCWQKSWESYWAVLGANMLIEGIKLAFNV